MLDIQFIRDNQAAVEKAAKEKKMDVDIKQLLVLDDQRKTLVGEIDGLRAQRNELASQAKGSKPTEEQIAAGREVKEKISTLEDELNEIEKPYNDLMLRVPNVTDESVPVGEDDQDNQPIKHWGDETQFDFEPKDHIEIMTAKDMADFERGVKVHGFRGYYLKGEGALLSWAIWNYANDVFIKKGFVPFIPPVIVREENLYGTSHLPNDAEDVYKTQDDDYLIGTSEIPLTGYHSDEILELGELPKKYLGFSPCFRREAGSYGRDTKGLIRVNEFFKQEQVIICEGTHEESVKWHEEINRNTEEFIESLGIPYRTVVNCTGDLGQGQVKKYDIELWVPMEKKYREISSASYFHDFQARRFNIRYKDADGKTQFAHTLNSTAIPTPRILVSLIENYQDKDGNITIPEVLRPYMGGREVI